MIAQERFIQDLSRISSTLGARRRNNRVIVFNFDSSDLLESYLHKKSLRS